MHNHTYFSDQDIKNIAILEANYHPQADLTDYYKLFFQAYYRQGHFIKDQLNANKMLFFELKGMKDDYFPLLQDISNGKGIYRVSLSVIKKRILTIDAYLALFLGDEILIPEWDDWTKIWQHIITLLKENFKTFNNRQQIEACQQMIEQKSIISHSELFRLTYKPHYRVMNLTKAVIEEISHFGDRE
ncbi:MAG TPA: hypothetical protein PKJ14_00145 [Candidatus Cloacimonadota bacterium]|nr:hypothetical protein [Candidatus Cloacimonadota bacterium]HQL14300.1 hypothetical protein [Candidatus Cloacimonadota bacterium]